jgi:segregation and condensation protein A
MPHELKLEKFEGPLAVLLKLIESEKLEITEISLANVTESYLNYINQSPEIPEEEMADFLVIAAKLLYIKSKALLPNLELEEDGLSLEDQLRMYKEYVEAAKTVEGIIKRKKFSYFREVPLKPAEAGFYPPKSLSAEKLRKVFEEILARIKPLMDLPKASLQKTISIKDRITQIHEMLNRHAKLGFKHLLADAKNRTEIIVSFLALLELTKQRTVMINQEGNFEEIIIEKTTYGIEL